MNLLSRLLEKRGIKDRSELAGEEREQFNRWQGILSGGDITVDKIKEFCETQKSIIDTQFENKDNSVQKNERLIVAHTIYSKLIRLITAPQSEKEALEKYLEALLLDK